MKITPLQWPVILISALGKSGLGSTGSAYYEQTKRNAWYSGDGGRKERKGKGREEENSGTVMILWMDDDE